MRRYLKYLSVHFKRTARVYIGILAMTLALLIALGIAAAALISQRSSSESYVKMQVGLVGDRSDSLLNMWITFIRQADSSSIAVDFVDCDSETDAISLLKARRLDSYIVIPDGFAAAAMAGENMQLRYVMAKSGASMSAVITQEVIEVISNYVIETQTGVGAMYEYARDLGYSGDERAAIGLDMSVKYISTVLDRGTLVSVQETGLGNNLSGIGYYVCGGTVFFVMALGIAFCTVRARSNRTLDMLLYSRGWGAVSQVTGEYLTYLLAVAFTVSIPLLAAGIISEFRPFEVNELSDWLFRDFALAVFKCLPALAVITAMQFLLYELTSGVINAVLLQFAVAVIMGYAGGCFYPLSFMPSAVQCIAALLPVGAAFNCVSGVLTASRDPMPSIICIAYAAGLLALAAAVRRLRIGLIQGGTV